MGVTFLTNPTCPNKETQKVFIINNYSKTQSYDSIILLTDTSMAVSYQFEVSSGSGGVDCSFGGVTGNLKMDEER